MNNRKKELPPEFIINNLYVRRKSIYKRLEVYFYLFLMFGCSALFLWWGTHAFFGALTAALSENELTEAKSIKDLWNVLMYFVPFTLFSLSAGCLAVCVLVGVYVEIIYWIEMTIQKKRRTSFYSKDTVRSGVNIHP